MMHPLEDLAGTSGGALACVPISAKTLGEAVAMAAGRFGVRIVAHDPPKWFRVYGVPGTDGDYLLVDIHVERDGQMTCPKQDLDFQLFESDVVSIGTLVC